MPFNEILTERIRKKLSSVPNVEEKIAFGGLMFMVNDKMCIGVKPTEIMVRINPNDVSKLENIDGWRPMIHGERVSKGFLFVLEDVLIKDEDLQFWVNLALDYNPLAKASKRKKS